MDLLSIFQAVWRHKLAAIPVIAFMLLGSVYVVKVKPPVYQANASFLLVLPPSPPTAAQIAADPGITKINPNNPYVNFGNLDVVADVLINLVTSGTEQQSLVQEGADPRYQVAISNDFQNPPIVQVTGVAASAAGAIQSADLVMNAAVADLQQIQRKQGVNSYYMIKAVELVQPKTAQETVSGKLRELIVVLVLGVILLFVVVSVMDVVDKRRAASRAAAAAPAHSAAGVSQQSAQFPDGGRRLSAHDADATLVLRGGASRDAPRDASRNAPRDASRDAPPAATRGARTASREASQDGSPGVSPGVSRGGFPSRWSVRR